MPSEKQQDMPIGVLAEDAQAGGSKRRVLQWLYGYSAGILWFSLCALIAIIVDFARSRFFSAENWMQMKDVLLSVDILAALIFVICVFFVVMLLPVFVADVLLRKFADQPIAYILVGSVLAYVAVLLLVVLSKDPWDDPIERRVLLHLVPFSVLSGGAAALLLRRCGRVL